MRRETQHCQAKLWNTTSIARTGPVCAVDVTGEDGRKKAVGLYMKRATTYSLKLSRRQT